MIGAGNCSQKVRVLYDGLFVTSSRCVFMTEHICVRGRTQAEGAVQVTGDCRTLHKGGLDSLYAMSNYLSDKIKEDEMGGAYGGEEECIQSFDRETCKKYTTLNT